MWHNIQFNANLIQHQTERAVLIKLPEEKRQFWHPIKCVHFVKGSGNSLIKIGVADDMVIRSHIPSANNQKIEEREHTAVELIDMMRGKCGNPDSEE